MGTAGRLSNGRSGHDARVRDASECGLVRHGPFRSRNAHSRTPAAGPGAAAAVDRRLVVLVAVGQRLPPGADRLGERDASGIDAADTLAVPGAVIVPQVPLDRRLAAYLEQLAECRLLGGRLGAVAQFLADRALPVGPRRRIRPLRPTKGLGQERAEPVPGIIGGLAEVQLSVGVGRYAPSGKESSCSTYDSPWLT